MQKCEKLKLNSKKTQVAIDRVRNDNFAGAVPSTKSSRDDGTEVPVGSKIQENIELQNKTSFC